MNSNYERFVSGGSLVPVLLILLLLVEWELLRSATPGASRAVSQVLGLALVPMAVFVAMLTVLRATNLVT